MSCNEANEHELSGKKQNFKTTCHGLFSGDVTAIPEILFIVPDGSKNPSNPLCNEFKLESQFYSYYCELSTLFLPEGHGMRVNFALLCSGEGRVLISDGLGEV